MKKIIAFAGSNNPYSINHQLLLAATKKIETASVHLITLSEFTVPIYGACVEKAGFPDDIIRLHQLFSEADGFIIASPEHNGLPTAFFKNILDWLSRIDQQLFGNKPVLLLSTSAGKNGGATNLQILSSLMPRWGATLTGTYSLPFFLKQFDQDNLLIQNPTEDQKLTEAVETFLQEILEFNLI